MVLYNQFHGLIKDPYDPRDHIYTAHDLILPPKVDNEPEQPGIRNQKSLGSCVGFGTWAALEEHYWKILGYPPDLSTMYIYMRAKESDPFPGTAHEGSTVRAGMMALVNYGSCLESSLPYNDRGISELSKLDPLLQNQLTEEAKAYKVGAVERVLGIQNVKHAIFRRGMVVVGMGIHKGWEHPVNGKIPFDPAKHYVEAGHCLDYVGYDDEIGGFKTRNSWGRPWGAGGYAYVSYMDAMVNLWDAWVITREA